MKPLEETLAEIEGRANAATPGPWDVRESHDSTKTTYVFLSPGLFYWPHYLHNEVTQLLGVKPNFKPNADFIAHARTDVPKLVDLCRRYEKALRLAVEQRNQYASSFMWDAVETINSADAEIAAILDGES